MGGWGDCLWTSNNIEFGTTYHYIFPEINMQITYAADFVLSFKDNVWKIIEILFCRYQAPGKCSILLSHENKQKCKTKEFSKTSSSQSRHPYQTQKQFKRKRRQKPTSGEAGSNRSKAGPSSYEKSHSNKPQSSTSSASAPQWRPVLIYDNYRLYIIFRISRVLNPYSCFALAMIRGLKISPSKLFCIMVGDIVLFINFKE